MDEKRDSACGKGLALWIEIIKVLGGLPTCWKGVLAHVPITVINYLQTQKKLCPKNCLLGNSIAPSQYSIYA